MRGINCRGSRLVLVAGLVIALAAPQLAYAIGASTTTTLTAGTLSGCVQPLTVSVAASGTPVTSGTVTINDEFNGNPVQLATVALSSSGSASPSVALAAGNHSLTASFPGIAGYLASISTPAVLVSVSTECEFTVGVSNFSPSSSAANTLTLTAGQSGSFTITVVPSVEFTSSLTAPMFVTLSCSGLPDGAACSATPENLEILPTTPESCPSGSPASSCPPTSNMVIQTYAASTVQAVPPTIRGHRSNPIAWAFLLPGTLGLGLAFGARRHKWLARFSLVILVGLVTVLGATGCNPRYNYEHHGPPANPATPPGTYNITVTAQSSNGVTAITHSTTFVLVVN
ncbi:MAG TPA: Ig-like domain-containing protein [Terracidiphilus sp.]|nr:Ig-like domain-containing protein [Terracidiphilus sp.]